MVEDSDVSLFKKKLKKLKEFKGKGTELITLYIPPNADRSSVMGQITEELSQSSNIKSPTTRKNVQSAIRRISSFLKSIDFKIPENGLVLFCGNVSEVEGRPEIRMFVLNPIEKLKTKLYWCDDQFHLAPLEEMIKPSEIYGLVVIDKRESTIALLKGKKYEVLGHFTSGVAGKTRAGGQCLAVDSLIQLSDGNIVEIKDCRESMNVKSIAFDNFSIRDSKIMNKWNTTKKGIRIVTNFPKTELCCSKDHFLFRIGGENGIEEVPASNIKVGDHLLMPEKLDVKGSQQFLNTNYFNNYKVTKNGLYFLIETRKKKFLSQEKLGEIIKVHQASISSFERGAFNPRLTYIKNYCKGLDIDADSFIKKYCIRKTCLKLPSFLTKDLAQFLGYLIGDGNLEKERVRFSEGNLQTAEFYRKLSGKLFNAKTSIKHRKSKNYFQVGVSGKPIVRFIEKEFPEAKRAEYCVPEKILKSSDKVISSFLKGLFDAEGYVTERSIAISMNNKKIIQQIQLLLLRFGIISSLHEYDNRRNIYSKKHRFTADITETISSKLFKKKIGLTSTKKTKKLNKLLNLREARPNISRSRQIIVPGKIIRQMFEEKGLNTQNFPKVTNFFRNERQMSKEVFKNSIIKEVKDKELLKEYNKILNIPLLPVKIKKLEEIPFKQKMIDISIKNQNFIVNGLIVHNSSVRFERLREEAAQEFFKRVSEKMNSAFLPSEKELKGIIVGGPGMTKNEFLNVGTLDSRLKQKVIGVVDTSYTDDSGIRELFFKSGEILKDTEIIKEKKLLGKFLEEIVKNGLVAYGQHEVEEALNLGKVKTLFVSEGIEWIVYKIQCTACNSLEEVTVKDLENFDETKIKCSKCSSSTQIELLEEIDYIDFLIEKARAIHAETKVISVDTSEGEQFLKGFGGIGAFLRYK